MNIEDNNSNVLRTNDPLLVPFLSSEKVEISQFVLAQLFEEYADPICSKIVSFRTRNIYGMTAAEKEALREDLRQEVRLKVLAHLRYLQTNPSTDPIYDFRNYVARITHNLLHDYFRAEFRPVVTVQRREIQLPPGEVREGEAENDLILPAKSSRLLPEFAVDIEDEEERILRLKLVWAELRQLPAKQCAAWLLKIADNDGESTLKWLPVFQIATICEIAAAIGQSAETLADIWKGLPLCDRSIAEMLGASQRQVINWRKSANERLQRRIRKNFAETTKKIKTDTNI